MSVGFEALIPASVRIGDVGRDFAFDPLNPPECIRNLFARHGHNKDVATANLGPATKGEVALSTVAFPIVQTNPQQDPVISFCYMGD